MEEPGPASFIRSTGRPYTEHVPEDLQEKFIDGVVEEYLKHNPPDAKDIAHIKMIRLEVEAIR